MAIARIVAFAMTIALALAPSLASAQGTQAETGVQSCERLALSFRLVSVKRLSQGAIRVEAEFENKSNDPYRVGWDKNATVLVDDQGERWPRLRVPTKLMVIPAGAKAKEAIEFSRQVGGADAKSVSITMKRGIYPPTGIGQYGNCNFSVNGALIEQ